MFDNFLNDSQIYRAAEVYWGEVCRDIIFDLEMDKQWSPWLNKCFVDGTAFRDGDPICSLISADERRVLRVRQIPEERDAEGLGVWFDLFGDTTRVLVLTVAVTEWRTRFCSALLSVWLDLRVPVDEAERIIRAAAKRMLA